MEIKYKLVGFDYADAAVADEINRNLSVLYATPAGTCAGDRNYGLDQEFVGLPVNIAENLLTLEIMEKTQQYEPRAQVLQVTAYSNQDGQTAATILIGPADDYDPDALLEDYAGDEEEDDDYIDDEEYIEDDSDEGSEDDEAGE